MHSQRQLARRLRVNFMLPKLGGVKPRIVPMVRQRVIAREQVPMHMRLGIAVAGVVHLPGAEGLHECLRRRHYFLKQCCLHGRCQLMEFPDMLFEQHQ